MKGWSDRLAGIAGLMAAAAIALEARGFTVDFLTDPLGPKALPLFAVTMLALGALLVVVRPEAEPEWPDRTGRLRIGAAAASFLAYAGLLAPLGFVVATALEGAALSRLFGGRWGQSVLAGAGASALLYVLFDTLLGIALPAGAAWPGLGGG